MKPPWKPKRARFRELLCWWTHADMPRKGMETPSGHPYPVYSSPGCSSVSFLKSLSETAKCKSMFLWVLWATRANEPNLRQWGPRIHSQTFCDTGDELGLRLAPEGREWEQRGAAWEDCGVWHHLQARINCLVHGEKTTQLEVHTAMNHLVSSSLTPSESQTLYTRQLGPNIILSPPFMCPCFWPFSLWPLCFLTRSLASSLAFEPYRFGRLFAFIVVMP